MTDQGPPRWLVLAIQALLPDVPEIRAALGDLHEAWGERRAKNSALRTGLWFGVQGLSLLRYWFPTGRSRPRRGGGLHREFRVAMRTTARKPLVLLAGIATLAPALAATGMGTMLAWTVLFRPLPYPGGDQLVVVEHNWRGFGSTGISTPLYRLYRDEARTVGGLGLVSWVPMAIDGADGTARRVQGAHVTASALALFGTRPALGRLLTPDDEDPGGPAVALLSHDTWTVDFGADPTLIGDPIEIDGVPHTVVGILEPSLEFPGGRPPVLLPVRFPRGPESYLNIEWWFGLAHLTGGASAREAQDELNGLLRRAVNEAPDGSTTLATLDQNDVRPVVTPLRTWETARIRDFVILLLGTVLLLLVLALAAMANLVLGRSEGREAELRLRRMLGASRSQVLGLLVAESTVLCGVIGLAGVVLSWSVVSWSVSSPELLLPRTQVSWLATVASTITGLLALGLIPLLASIPLGRARLAKRVVLGSRATAWTTARQALLGAQVAVSAIFLVGAITFLQSAVDTAATPLGFASEDVLTFQASLSETVFENEEDLAEFHRLVLERVASVPGVTAFGYADGLPVSSVPWNGAMLEVEGLASADGSRPTHRWGRVSTEFLDAIGVTLQVGRLPTPADVEDQRPVAVVDQAFAEMYWSSAERAIGQRIRRGPDRPWLEIIGIVGNTLDIGPRTEAPVAYVPSSPTREPLRDVVYALRAEGDPEPLVSQVRRAIGSVDSSVPVFDVMTMAERISAIRAKERLAFRGIGLSSAASLLVVVVSLAGLVLLSVIQGRREIGIRKALGASDRALRLRTLRAVLAPTAAGLLVGMATVVLGVRVPESLLSGVASPLMSVIPVAGSLLVVVASVGALATRRVNRVEPAEALRLD